MRHSYHTRTKKGNLTPHLKLELKECIAPRIGGSAMCSDGTDGITW